MGKIVWNESFSVGIQELDNHHQRLVDLINTLVDHVEGKQDVQVVRKTLSALDTYAFYHFGQEEQMMAERGLPFLDAHLAEHEQFCEMMKEIRNDTAVGLNDFKRLVDFLVVWWSHHILEVDMQYKP